MTLRPDPRPAPPAATAGAAGSYAGPCAGSCAGLDGLVAHLASFESRPALVGPGVPGGAMDYAALADRVAGAAAAYGSRRRLILLEAGRDVDSLVAYLGALAAGQAVLLAGPDAAAALAAAWDPDLRLDPSRAGDLGAAIARADAARPVSAHGLHPDLRLLLSTSGSTGSPRLVRLSAENLVSNAHAIAASLGIRPTDVAPTVLPLGYCYGLSVLHSHLAVGAALLLTDASVSDECFWEEAARHQITSLAGVPHTFDLLERVGLPDRLGALPRLRMLTQAGGRMPPETVRRWAELGQVRGFDLVVMYGQTEATARMAFLPPDLAPAAPEAVGRAIPGSRLTVEPVPDPPPGLPHGTGELVLRGPGVMLGYAETPADLARGRDLTALRTGDLGRVRPDGLLEVVGRRSRFAKVLGLRLDLDRVERLLAAEGTVVTAADGGDRLVLGVAAEASAVDPARVRGSATRLLGLPAGAVAVVVRPELPRLAHGKPDHRALAALAAVAAESDTARAPGPPGPPGTTRVSRSLAAATAADVAAVYAAVLGRPDAGPDDAFTSLGGDSLSYVEASLRLEDLLGGLPAGWPARTAADLAAAAGGAGSGGASARPGLRGRLAALVRPRGIEVSVLLRAFAIVSIVGTHANLFTLLGGAHLLLAVAGFNLARFPLAADTARERSRRMLRAAARIAIPAVLVIAVVSLWTEGLGWRQALLVNGLGQQAWSEPAWYYWFIEVLVTILVMVAALFAVPGVDRLERRLPFALPVALALLALVTRYGVVPTAGDQIHRAHVVFWLFALGWAAARARTPAHRVLLTAIALGSVPGFFDEGARNAYVAAGLAALVWLPTLRVPDALARSAGTLAGASLWIYLLHWQVYPHLEYRIPWLATVLSLLAGVLAWRAAEQVTARVRLLSRGPAPASPGTAPPVTGNDEGWLTVHPRSSVVDEGMDRASSGDGQPAHVAARPARHR